ncbi:indolepyruvate oxidoreductase subunit beta [Chloroflexota bacterium]
MQPYNIIIAGVGGQGVIRAGNITGDAALSVGYDVKKTDTLGMAQRGGSVISHLRIAEKVYSPLIKKGEADILLAFEKLEAARWSGWLRPGGVAVVNNQALPPLSVSLGDECYPSDEEITAVIEEKTKDYYIAGGTDIAIELGNVKALNVFMLGCLSRLLPLGEDIWMESIAQGIPQKVVALNMEAFKQGRQAIASKKMEKDNG